MKKRLYIIMKVFLFCALLSAVLVFSSRITQRKESLRKYADLYAAAPEADVLFLGSSHVINGINPALLYEEYGIAGYNLGGHGSILPASYWELMNALDYFSPQLVVVDGCLMERDYHYLNEMTEEYTDENRASSVSQLHLNLDVFPLSRNKFRAVRDLLSDRSLQAEFLFPFIVYHNRWSSLTGDDFASSATSRQANRLLGAEIRTGVAWQIAPHTMGDDALTDEIHLGEQYLQLIFKACRERNIDICVTFLPCNSTALDRQTAARLEALSAAEGFPYLNYLTEDVTSTDTDFNDEGHLNLLGMTKTTRRLGAFLRDHTSLPDRRGNAAYALWEKRSEDYHRMLDACLYDTDTLSEALQSLAADRERCDAVLYLSGTGAAIGDPAVRSLTDALAPGNSLRETACAGEPALFILSADGEARDYCGYQVVEWTDLGFASVELVQVENFTGFYLNGDDSENLLNMEDDRMADAQLVLLDPETGEIKRQLIFNYSNFPQRFPRENLVNTA